MGKMTHNYNQNTMGYNSHADVSWGYFKNRNFNDPNLITYMESHDEERLMYKNLQFGNSSGGYSVKNLNIALSRQELAGVFFFTIPGPKMIWQFGELGYDISIDQNGRTGRKPVRWDYFDVAERKKTYDIWSTLIHFKTTPEVFSTNDIDLDVTGLVKRINLNHDTNNVVLIGNFDVTEKTVNPNFPSTGTWHEYFTSASEDITNTTAPITLQPGEYRLYSSVALQNPLSTENITRDSLQIVLYSNPSSNYFVLNKEVESLKIYNIAGKEVKNINKKILKQEPIQIGNLSKGVYFVKIKTNNLSVLKKLLIK